MQESSETSQDKSMVLFQQCGCPTVPTAVVREGLYLKAKKKSLVIGSREQHCLSFICQLGSTLDL